MIFAGRRLLFLYNRTTRNIIQFYFKFVLLHWRSKCNFKLRDTKGNDSSNGNSKLFTVGRNKQWCELNVDNVIFLHCNAEFL